MPTKNKIGHAEIKFLLLLPGLVLTPSGIARSFRYWHTKIRYGGISPGRRWVKLFDTSVEDLSTLPIGLFDSKAWILPRRMLPTTSAGLLTLCRQLIDRGEDDQHIAIMTKGWLGNRTLEDHVADLWELREPHRRLYEDIVRGRHGRARSRLERDERGGITFQSDIESLIYRQGMALCAMDVQAVTGRCRQSFISPCGPLVSTTLKVLGAGTLLRLIKNGVDSLAVALGGYQTEDEEAKEGPNGAKPEGKVAKAIAHQAEKQILSATPPIPLSDYRRDLDEAIPYVRSRLASIMERLPFYSTVMTDKLAPRTNDDGTLKPRSNGLRHFHSIWYSDLSAPAGMSVAMYRYVQAEQRLPSMIKNANSGEIGGEPKQIEPLPALPTDPKELEHIRERVLDLVHSGRRVQLRDTNFKSKSRGGAASIKAALLADPSLADRDPLDKAGLTFVMQAERFLQAAGMRPRDAHIRKPGEDESVLTYWHMDVIPEFRLSF